MAKRNKTEEVTEQPAQEQQQDDAVAARVSNSPYGVMLTQAAKLQTAYRTGAPLQIFAERGDAEGAREIFAQDYIVPGIMIYRWYPTLGVSDSATSPASMAAKTVYSYVRAANSGARNYQPSDLQIYTLALDSIYSLYFQLVRVIGTINYFTPFNTYYPEALVRSLGFDYNDYVDNLPAVVFQMANWAAKLKQFALPSTMRLYSDHRDLSLNIYRDGDTERAQMYAFVQDGFWSYEMVDQVKGLRMVTPYEFGTVDFGYDAQFNYPALTWKQTQALFNSLLNAFLTSDDVALISGDITKAYAEQGFVDLPIIDLNYSTPVGKSDMLLTAIMNADIVPVDPISMRVVDAPDQLGYIVSKPGFSIDNFCKYAKFLGQKDVNLMVVYFEYMNNMTTPIVGNTPFANFVADSPSELDMVAAMRFRLWIDEESVKVNTNLITADAYKANGPYPATGTRYHLSTTCDFAIKTCGTEIIHAAQISQLQPSKPVSISVVTATQATGTNFVTAPFTTVKPWQDVQQFIGWTRSRMTSNSDNATLNPTIYANDHGNEVLVALASLANFDWHHRVYVVNRIVNTGTGTTTTNATTPPYIDMQHAVPLAEENIQQFNDAYLYYAFFE